MSSKVEICNMALGRVNSPFIDSIDEKSKEAKICRLYYDQCRKAALRAHGWNFATETVDLALLAETKPEWDFVYQIPSDCLKVIGIVPAISGKKIPYKISGKKILTNMEEATLRYVKDITDPNMFDDQFIVALSYLLASDIAVPLTGKPAYKNNNYQFYVNELNQAKTADADEAQEEVEDSILNSRN
ncbi:MAG: hypothetical protein WC637_21885 [Victivallales bacterium]|jgi:hypothetical protein